MVISYHYKGIDGKNNQFWLSLCVIHKVEIYKFLQLEVLGMHILQDIGKQS
jgi:hypothetical protein